VGYRFAMPNLCKECKGSAPGSIFAANGSTTRQKIHRGPTQRAGSIDSHTTKTALCGPPAAKFRAWARATASHLHPQSDFPRLAGGTIPFMRRYSTIWP
jgi:hypothetical protein